MPLSAECAELVTKQREAESFDFASLSGEDAVAYVSSLRAAFPVVSDSVRPDVKIADRTLPVGDGGVPVRLYSPPSNALLPVAAFFHGGGWVAGSPSAYDRLCAELAAAASSVIVSVAYRLAPEHRFPAAFEDGCAALDWLAGNAAEVGGYPDHLSVIGLSAGGNLAAAAALHARDKGEPAIRRQVLVYPVLDQAMRSQSYREMGEGFITTFAQIGFFWDQYVPDGELRRTSYASPLESRDLSGLPPALVFGAEFDPLRGDGEAYAENLRAAGGDATFELCAGQIHGFLSLFPASQASHGVIAKIGAELAESA